MRFHKHPLFYFIYIYTNLLINCLKNIILTSLYTSYIVSLLIFKIFRKTSIYKRIKIILKTKLLSEIKKKHKKSEYNLPFLFFIAGHTKYLFSQIIIVMNKVSSN